jgi:methyltransferase (TIGR00027 family)
MAEQAAVIRSRYAEDELLVAVERGTSQYVILGAGLDTFAYRTPHLSKRLTVFEVDHPATQQWKRARLGEIGIEAPGNLHFVPVDFQTSSLAERLAASGFNRRAPAFFSWLGVTYYLTRGAIFDTLKFVATQDAASQVVFDFAMEDSTLGPQARAEIGLLMTKLAQRGEPWLTRFDPAALAADLHRTGFGETFYLSERIAAGRYLSGRADNLQISEALQIMSARR